MVIVLIAVSGRFSLLAWAGYRDGRVKTAWPWSSYWDRRKTPRLYWTIMGFHLFNVVGLTSIAMAAMLGLASISN